MSIKCRRVGDSNLREGQYGSGIPQETKRGRSKREWRNNILVESERILPKRRRRRKRRKRNKGSKSNKSKRILFYLGLLTGVVFLRGGKGYGEIKLERNV